MYLIPITLATGWSAWWVNQQCNLDPGAVPQVLLYFPIVILIVAISLFLVEKFFNVAFKVGDEAKHFYDLLVKLKVLDKKGKKNPNIILGINLVTKFFDLGPKQQEFWPKINMFKHNNFILGLK